MLLSALVACKYGISRDANKSIVRTLSLTSFQLSKVDYGDAE